MTDKSNPREFQIGDVVKTVYDGQSINGIVYKVSGSGDYRLQDLWIDAGDLHLFLPSNDVELISPAPATVEIDPASALEKIDDIS